MSTKTSTIKRIALVAVAALGFGMLSTVPSSAANEITFTGTTGVTGSGTTSSDPFVATVGTPITITSALSAGFTNPVTISPVAAWMSIDPTSALITGTPTAAAAVTAYTVSNPSSPAKTGTFYLLVNTTATSNNTPWRISSGTYTGGDVTATSVIQDASTYVVIKAANNTASTTGINATTKLGSYRYAKITSGNSTFSAVTSGLLLDGTPASGSVAGANYVPGTGTMVYMPTNGVITGEEMWVRTATAGTVTVEYREYVAAANAVDPTKPLITDTKLQTITITVTAPTVLNAGASTALLCSTPTAGDGTYPKVGCGFTGTTDDVVLAKSALVGTGTTTSAAGTQKAAIKVDLKDIAGTNLVASAAPSFGASISGPGTLSIGYGAAGNQASAGRNLTVAAGTASSFYINVFSDGTSGVATISIWVGGSVWKTKTVTFYGDVTKIVASQNHKVLKAGTTTGALCGGVAATPTSCVGTSIATTYAIQVLATDANGIAVPGVTYTAVPDATVVTASAPTTTGNADADSLGATWFSVSTNPAAASGATGTVSYKVTVGTATLVTNTLTFAIGGAVSTLTATLGADSSTEVGAKNTLAITAKDAAGNAPYDQDLASTLKSNVALVSGTSAATSGLPASFALLNGSASSTFFNPVVPGDVTISGTVGGVAASLTVSVANSATNAAVDAANEATDAANAATDAANAAAEAADAATAAAQDAQAAVAELATRVASLIAAIKAQITSLTNLIIKIKKKVRA